MEKTGFTFRGKEIILSKTRGRPFSGLVKKGMAKGIYPEQKRIEAVTIYAATGVLARTSELTGIPYRTLQLWKKEPWWQDLLYEIRAENNEKIDVKFTEIIESALDQLSDRIKNGDHHVLRDGTLIRKPVAAKDLSLVAAINVDKRQLLRGEPTSRSEAIGKVEEGPVNRLEKLAETFENLARLGRRSVDTIEHVEDAQLIEADGPDGGGTSTETPTEGYPEDQVQEREGVPQCPDQ